MSPSHRARRTRDRRPATWPSRAVLHVFETGELPEGPALFGVLALPAMWFRATWTRIRDEYLAQWAADHPGRRPSAWWTYDAPEPRRRVGGIGDVFAAGKLRFGIETDWTSREQVMLYTGRCRHVAGHFLTEFTVPGFAKVAVDPSDPPAHESQASYLARLDLFLPGERARVPADAFAPERLVVPVDALPADGRVH